MYEYVLWGDIQSALEQAAKTAGGIGFFGAYQQSKERALRHSEVLRYPPLETWDCRDPQALYRMFSELPVTFSNVGGSVLRIPFQEGQRTHFHEQRPYRVAPLTRYEKQFYTADRFTAFYVLDGRAELTVSNSGFDLTGGDVCIVAPEATYRFLGGPDCVAVALIVWEKHFARLFQKILRHKNILTEYYGKLLERSGVQELRFHLRDQSRFFHLVRELLCEFLMEKEYSEEIGPALMELFFLYAIREGSQFNIEGDAGREQGLNLTSVLRCIHEQFPQLTLTALAAQIGYAPGYLSRQLKQATGRSFQQLVAEERLAAAKELLEHTELRMEEISEALGYASQVSFSID